MKDYSNEKWVEEIIQEAEKGDYQAAIEVLDLIRSKLLHNYSHDPLFSYLDKALGLYLDEHVPLLTALGLDAEPSKLGRKHNFPPDEVASTDILLRDYCKFKPEQACEWFEAEFGIDRRTVQRIRNKYDSRFRKEKSNSLTDGLSKDQLLHLSGSMRKNIEAILPQT